MLMSPGQFLVLVCVAMAAIVIVHVVLLQVRRGQIRKLAQEWQMHYTPGDRFKLGTRVATELGVPGAASVRVEDVIYASEGDSYRYYFTAVYTAGVLKRQTDHRRVCTATEKKERSSINEIAALELGPMELPVVEQYRRLRSSATSRAGSLKARI